jgi:hypothetical protein
VHGTQDRVLPFDSTAARLPALIADCTLVSVEGGPHNIGWTHADEVNARCSRSSGSRDSRMCGDTRSGGGNAAATQPNTL